MTQKRSIAETPYPSLNKCWVKGRGFPFGKRIDGLSVNTSDPQDRYKYNGKELDTDNDLNWLADGLRYFDPELGRWHTTDRISQTFSKYTYSFNNPVYFKDYQGLGGF